MLFNQLTFFLFLTLVFSVYWILQNRLRVQNIWILIASYFFYACWDWRFLVLIAISSGTDYLIGLRLSNQSNIQTRKWFLALSLLVNLGMLGFFKYFNFFAESAHVLLASIGLATSAYSLNIILPVGISFYTFQTLSYTIDIYRKKIPASTNWVDFFAFVSFFPQLVAGPIERAADLLPQFSFKRTFDAALAIRGLRLVLWGLFKKMVIADRLAPIVDSLYADPVGCNSWMAALAGVLFAIQVYGDFSGYSDIAIGSARLLGFRLSRNFIAPFLSKSMTEFWQRWHITLSTWFRDYLYISLGGNRVSKSKWALLIILTFTLSGLWHGADFHYVLWGFLCAIPLIFERLTNTKTIGAVPTFALFGLLIIMFRASGVSAALAMYESLFSFNFNMPQQLPIGMPNFYDLAYTATLTALFITSEIVLGKIDFDEYLDGCSIYSRRIIYYLLLVVIGLFGIFDNAPQFIYFQF